MKFKCFFFQKETLFYVFGSVLLGMIIAVSICFPGSGLF